MSRALFEKEVYIRFAEEPMAFVYTVQYGRFTVKSAHVLISNRDPNAARVDEKLDDVSNTVNLRLRKPTHGSSGRAG